MSSIRAMEAFARLPISVGPFIQSTTGAVVPFFTDPRMVYSHPDVLDVIVEEVAQLIQPYQRLHDLILLGVAYSGVPLAMALSRAMRIPFCYLAKERKQSMGHKIVEGDVQPGSIAVLIDDILGSGKTIRISIEHASEDAVLVRHVVVMYDVWPSLSANMQTRQDLEKSAVTIDCLFHLDDFLDYLQQTGRISSEAWEVRRAYNHDALGWNKNQKLWKMFELIKHRWTTTGMI